MGWCPTLAWAHPHYLRADRFEEGRDRNIHIYLKKNAIMKLDYGQGNIMHWICCKPEEGLNARSNLQLCLRHFCKTIGKI